MKELEKANRASNGSFRESTLKHFLWTQCLCAACCTPAPRLCAIPLPGVSSGQRILFGEVHLADRYGPWRKNRHSHANGSSVQRAAFSLLKILLEDK